MGKRDNDARRAQIEREAEEELRRLAPPPGVGGGNRGGGFGAPPGAGGPMGGAGMGPISPIEMMAERVRRREVGREAHGEQPRRQGPPARPPVELFSGPVGSGLTPGFGPGKHYQTPPAFAEQADPGPSGYDTPGFVSPEYDDYDEDEEISITEMAVMDNAARHGLRPEEAVVQQIDGVTAEEMRDQAMQQFIKRQGRLQTGGGIVTDPFAPMGMRGRPAPPPEPRGGPSGRLNTRRANQGRPAVGAIARLQERRRQEEEARRLEEEAALELEGAYNPTDTFDDDLAGGGITALADSSGTGPETFDAYEELDEPEPEPAEEYGGGAIGRLLAGRARAARDKGDTTSGGKLFGGQVRPVVPAKQDGAEQDGADGNGNDGFEVAEVTGEPDDREESEAWSGGAPGRLHARERMHARGATGGEAEEDAPSSHLEQLMARASEGEPMPPASTRRSRDRKPVPKGRRRALAPQAGVEQPAKRASLRKAAATTKGARKVATVNKAAGAGTTTTKGGKATSEKGASGRVAEKAAMDKTPTARRARAIKSTAKKASSAKAPVKKTASAKTINDAPAAKVLKAAKAPAKAVAATKGGKATSDKGAGGRAAEKAAMDKTPTARRARAIKATAKKASSAKKTGRTSR